MSSPSPDCETPITRACLQFQFGAVQRVDRGCRQRDRNAGGDFQEIAAKQRGIVRTAARDKHDQIDVALFQKLPQARDLSCALP